MAAGDATSVGDAGITGKVDPVSDTKNLQFKVVDVVGPASYTAGGISLANTSSGTAATNLTNTLTTLGFSRILGCFVLAKGDASLVTKTTGWDWVYDADSGRVQLMTAGAAGTGDVECTAATNVSAFGARLMFVGVPV